MHSKVQTFCEHETLLLTALLLGVSELPLVTIGEDAITEELSRLRSSFTFFFRAGEGTLARDIYYAVQSDHLPLDMVHVNKVGRPVGYSARLEAV
jgi:hypothetical protein